MEKSKLDLFVTLVFLWMFLLQPLHSTQYINPSAALAKKFKNAYNPEQIHLSFGSKTNNIVVMWSTSTDEDGYVEYGASVEKLSKVTSNRAELKQNSEQCAKYLHRVELKDLTPGEHYTYRIVCETSGLKSDTYTFIIPSVDPKKSDVFIVFADLGRLTKSLPFLIHEILNYKYKVVFHIGDIAYNLEYEGGSAGDDFMQRIQKFTAQVPYMTTPGDHEREITTGKDTFYHYMHRFSMPNAQWPMKEDSLWYSINIGRTHFISINTETLLKNTEIGRKQIKWLRADLEEANQHRQTYPWIIVMGHKPMYCTKSVMEQLCDKDTSPLRDAVEDLFFEFGVDVYMSGHKHCYERTWPMYLGRMFQEDYVNPKAPVYLTIGSMGYEYIVDKQLSMPYWLAFSSADRTKELFARLIINDTTTLLWSVHDTKTNAEVDRMIIVQKSHGSFGIPGPAAFDQSQARQNIVDNLPPQPFYIADNVLPWHVEYRRFLLYLIVFSLSFLLFVFLRQTRLHKMLR